MKILVAIANHGNGSRQYVDRVMAEYRSMSHDVDLVILSNIPKDMGDDVEVIVGLPSKNPWSLPFGHKQLFADRINDYDLFIYSEDDILVSQRNIDAFVDVTPDLQDDEIAGFMRVEYTPSGTTSYDMMHSYYRWGPRTVRERGGDLYAWLSNEHAAAYIVNREQLQRAIDSGGFLVEPYESRYDLLCTAATDPYTSCGMTKLLNLDRLEDFEVHHIPNKYIGKYGIEQDAMAIQLDALRKVHRSELPAQELIDVETRLHNAAGSKMVYADVDHALIECVPESAKRVLVVGCGAGDTELELIERGHAVTAIPVDSVIGAFAAARGVITLEADLPRAVEKLAGQTFDAVVFPESLQLFPDPVKVLASIKPLVAGGATVLASVPNLGEVKTTLRLARHDHGLGDFGGFSKVGVHRATRGKARQWLLAAGLDITRSKSTMSASRAKYNRLSAGLGTSLLADRWIMTATAPCLGVAEPTLKRPIPKDLPSPASNDPTNRVEAST